MPTYFFLEGLRLFLLLFRVTRPNIGLIEAIPAKFEPIVAEILQKTPILSRFLRCLSDNSNPPGHFFQEDFEQVLLIFPATKP